MAPQEECTEDRLRQNVQDTVEDGLGIWGDDVSALGNSPCDWVEEPEEDGPDTTDEVCFTDVLAESAGVLARGPGDGPSDPEESDASKGEVAPLDLVRIAQC